jgi:Ferritin-like domain
VRASRRQLLLAAAAALGVARTAAAAGSSDAELLAGLLARERELEAAYAWALERGVIDRALGERLLGHELEHVRGLEQVLRGRAAPGAEPSRPQADGPRAFARAALALESGAVAAYTEALTRLRDKRLLQPLGSIMGCGAQHEVALRQALGRDLL